MSFAVRLAEVGRDAPPGFCRDEVMRLVNNIRTKYAVPDDERKRRVVYSIATGAREVDEIADDCQFSRGEIERLLKILIDEKVVEKRPRGGTLNRGRKMKFYYFLISN